MKTGAHWPPSKRSDVQLAVFQKVVKKKQALAKAKDEIRRDWCVNVTMLDADWHVNVDLAEGVMAMDPYDLMDTLYVESGLEDPTNKSTLYHFVAHFFEQVASAICSLRGRFVVEIIHGEISSIMEKSAMMHWIRN